VTTGDGTDDNVPEARPPAGDGATDELTVDDWATGGSRSVDLRTVDVHIDLMCPWAYQTSVWLRDVRAQTGLQIRWRWFSLEEVNRAEGKKHPWERAWAWGWSLMRIGAWLRRIRGDEAVDVWCAAAGKALHVDGRKVHTPEVAREVLREAGLEPLSADAAVAEPTTHDDVRADHQRVVDLGGFGVPTLVFGADRALFGPVVREAPTGPESLRLWELVTGWLEFPALYEMRRPKTADDWARIGDHFAPYLSARDWPTIQHEVL
jgi:2-hydroxychromene-2-carboxylate isomerase